MSKVTIPIAEIRTGGSLKDLYRGYCRGRF